MQWLFPWIAQYGYGALFLLLMFGILGLPIPDETLLFFCGYLIWKGRLHFDLTVLTAFAGSSCGISLSYVLGRRYGRRLIHHYGPRVHVTPQRVHRVYDWFHRIGGWALTIGYFVPGVRHFTALVAGMAHMRCLKFAGFAYLGAAIWVSTFLSLGYMVGEGWEQTSEMLHRWILIGTEILAVSAFVLWRLRRSRHSRTR